MLAFAAFPRQFKGITDYAFATMTREHSRLHRHLLWKTLVLKPTDIRILTLGVLAHYDQVDVVWRNTC